VTDVLDGAAKELLNRGAYIRDVLEAL